jgi:hypothetical protein
MSLNAIREWAAKNKIVSSIVLLATVSGTITSIYGGTKVIVDLYDRLFVGDEVDPSSLQWKREEICSQNSECVSFIHPSDWTPSDPTDKDMYVSQLDEEVWVKAIVSDPVDQKSSKEWTAHMALIVARFGQKTKQYDGGQVNVTGSNLRSSPSQAWYLRMSVDDFGRTSFRTIRSLVLESSNRTTDKARQFGLECSTPAEYEIKFRRVCQHFFESMRVSINEPG